EEVLVYGGLASQQPNAFPLLSSRNTLRDETLDLFDGHVLARWGLLARAVAVVAVEVAGVGDVDLDEVATAPILGPQKGCHRLLDSPKVVFGVDELRNLAGSATRNPAQDALDSKGQPLLEVLLVGPMGSSNEPHQGRQPHGGLLSGAKEPNSKRAANARSARVFCHRSPPARSRVP